MGALAGCLLLFAVDLALVESGVTRPADRDLELEVHGLFGHPWYGLFVDISAIAGGAVRILLIAAIVVALAIGRKYIPAALVAVAAGGAALLQTAIKLTVARPRPTLFAHVVTAGGYSFPSGHAADTFAFCAIAVYALAVWRAPRGALVGAGIAGAAIALLVGLSRVVLGVHYPSDVVGGYAMAGAWCILVLVLAPRLGMVSGRRAVPLARDSK